MPAEDSPLPLERLTYVAGDGTPAEDGVAALARALEHVNLAWALVGFAIRLPLVRPFLQLVADAVGAGPQPIPVRARR